MKYYEQIDKGIREYEDFSPCPQHTLSGLTDRIVWCWKYRKITHRQMEELCDRMCNLFDR